MKSIIVLLVLFNAIQIQGNSHIRWSDDYKLNTRPSQGKLFYNEQQEELEDDREFYPLFGQCHTPTWNVFQIFDQANVSIVANQNIEVWFDGGTEFEPHPVEGFSRLYCSWNVFQRTKQCNVMLSTVGRFAPFGCPRIAVRAHQSLWASNGLDWEQPLVYTLRFQVVTSKTLMVSLAIGIILWYLAPRLSHSRVLHISAGTLFGTFGAVLLVVIILTRVLPGKRKAVVGGAIFGLGGIAISSFWRYVQNMLTQYIFFVVIIMVIGAIFGYILSYKYQLDQKSQDLFGQLLRLAAFFMIFAGTNSLIASGIIFSVLALHTMISYYCCRRGHGSSTSEQGQETPKYHEEGAGDADIKVFDDEQDDEKVYTEGSHRIHRTPRRSTSSSGKQYTPSRYAEQEFFQDNLGSKKARPFICQGAPDYVSDDQYESESADLTAKELSKLYKRCRQGGDIINCLSPIARRNIAKQMYLDDLTQDIDETIYYRGGR